MTLTQETCEKGYQGRWTSGGECIVEPIRLAENIVGESSNLGIPNIGTFVVQLLEPDEDLGYSLYDLVRNTGYREEDILGEWLEILSNEGSTYRERLLSDIHKVEGID